MRLLFLLICVTGVTPLWCQNIFTEAQELFRNKNNHQAIEKFETFVKNYPESNKIDDSYWYLGRLHARIDNHHQSRVYFLKVIHDETSNRQTEAFSDLIPKLDKSDEEALIIDLFRKIKLSDRSDKYIQNNLPLILKSYYLTGLRHKSNNHGLLTLEYWSEGLETIAFYKDLGLQQEFLLKREILFHTRIFNLVPENTSHKNQALTLLNRYSSLYGTNDFTKDIESNLHPDEDELIQNYQIMLNSGFDSFTSRLNTNLDLRYEGQIDQNIDIDVKYELNTNYFKTTLFNSESENPYNDQRHELDFGISYTKGSRYFAKENYALGIEYVGYINSPGSYIELQGEVFHSNAVAPYIRKNQGAGIKLQYYPGLNADNISLSGEQAFVFSVANNMDLGIAVGLKAKQYINSIHQTASGEPADFSRLYVIPNIEADFNWKLEDFTIDIKHNVTYLKDYFYDVIVDASPAPRFISSYFTNLENTSTLTISFDIQDIQCKIQGSYLFKDFFNYPARNVANEFINEMRSDRLLKIQSHLLWPLAIEGWSLYGQSEYRLAVSNMTYTKTVLANYSRFIFDLGIEFEG